MRDEVSVHSHVASLFSDLPATRERAIQEERNTLARLACQPIEIEDDHVVAIVPTPDLAPTLIDEETQSDRIKENGNGPENIGAVDLRLDEAEATGYALAG